MQIHELTYKRRIDEASFGGAIKNIGSAIGAVGAGIGKELASQAGFDTAGTVGASSDTKNGAFARAKALTVPMIKPQAIENQKLWNQLAAQKMAAAGVSSLSALPSDQMDELDDALRQQIAKNFLKGQTGNDYGQLPEKVVPQMKAEADKVVGLLDDAIDSIMNVGFNKTPAQSLDDWTKLVTAGFDAMRLLQFYPAPGTQQRVAASAVLTPKATALMNAIGLDQAGLVALKAAITKSNETINSAGTGSESLDDLLRAARLLQ
jgi:hypothetical protein